MKRTFAALKDASDCQHPKTLAPSPTGLKLQMGSGTEQSASFASNGETSPISRPRNSTICPGEQILLRGGRSIFPSEHCSGPS